MTKQEWSTGDSRIEPEARFRTNSPSVTAEVIDGEAIIIHLVNGNYYSLDNAGADIWMLLASHQMLGSIVEYMAQRYQDPKLEIRASIVGLISELLEEELIVPCTDLGSVAPVESEVLSREGRTEFQRPVLRKFTDMQELLILDPIHEVDEAGWPNKKYPSSV